MWFDYTDSFYVSDEDFNEMIESVKHGLSVDRAFDNWRAALYYDDYERVLCVENKIKNELRKRLNP